MKLAKRLNFIDGNYDTCRAFLGKDIQPVSLLFDRPTYSEFCGVSKSCEQLCLLTNLLVKHQTEIPPHQGGGA